MDEMKLKLSTKFMRNIAAKLISKVIFNKLGVKTTIKLNEIEIKDVDGRVFLHINADAEFNDREFIKATRLVDLEDEES